MCAGSDAPITEPDWRQGVAGMPLRESKAGGRVSGPEQRVELTEALRAYIAEEGKAPVEVGRVADLCVPDRPPADLDPHVITEVGVDMTVFDGGVVFER
ncbi:amidohydrolase family protein [Streptomyces bottropensis]|uniref:amidohydrolase family protein n=1 Tax=Streptomyces bottropensis TaxID=42235 RepID=UPI003692731D